MADDAAKNSRTALLDWLPAAGLPLLMLGCLLLDRLPQDDAYHRFADERTLLSLPHFWNVVSNLPFTLVGVVGLLRLAQGRLAVGTAEKPAAAVLLVGVGLTGFGSAWYHLDPTNGSLMWDRLPMTLAFMGLFAVVLGERIRPEVGRVLLAPLLLLGTGSVFYWSIGEERGAGNLLPYIAVQFYPLCVIPILVLIRPSRWTRGADYLIALGFYALAKVMEMGDRPLYEMLGGVGGHPIKHLIAALGAWWIVRMFLRRSKLPG